MKILVDADACPVISIIEKTASQYKIPVILLCDTNHCLKSDYSEIRIISAGKDAVDYALVNTCDINDIVVSQDYGVAAMALSKGAFCINQNGKWYTQNNIDSMLNERYIAQKVRMASKKNHLKGPKKRKKEDDLKFENSFLKLILFAKEKGHET